jgi:hypothetical protein
MNQKAEAFDIDPVSLALAFKGFFENRLFNEVFVSIGEVGR